MRKQETKNVSVRFHNEADSKIFFDTMHRVKRKLTVMTMIQMVASIGMLFFLIGFAINYAHDKGYPFSEDVAIAFCVMGFSGLLFPLVSSVFDLFEWVKDTFF